METTVVQENFKFIYLFQLSIIQDAAPDWALFLSFHDGSTNFCPHNQHYLVPSLLTKDLFRNINCSCELNGHGTSEIFLLELSLTVSVTVYT